MYRPTIIPIVTPIGAVKSSNKPHWVVRHIVHPTKTPTRAPNKPPIAPTNNTDVSESKIVLKAEKAEKGGKGDRFIF